MKLNFRDLKQQKFTIDAEPSDTVLQVKEKIAADKGWEASTQKLIYSGKILADANTVESYKIDEKGFIVCMVSKPKAAPAPKAAPPATPATTSSTPAPPAAPQQSSSTPAAANPPATPTPAQSAQVPAPGQTGFGDQSAMLVGNRSDAAVREIEAMGFDRPDIERALRAAYYNPDRAIDYLLNGIPENIQAEQRAAQQQQQQGQAQQGQGPTSPPAAGAQTGTTPAQPAATQPAGEEVNLFEQAAQAAQGGGARGGAGRGAAAAGAGAGAGLAAALGGAAGAGGGAGGNTEVNMDFLRNSEHFQHLRRLVQQQPAMLEPILQQVAEGNPQLAQIISQNSEAFLQLLSEDLTGGEGGGLPAGSIHVTQEESDAIERLCGLGFARERVIQAYFACDKNEELAANFLFEQPDDDE
ncbi:UV excision repair protein rad23 [Knufia obscura]|uniref:UV excision repair protein RAD23 n=2 Tax=Knufia TaxID=430999 RepID=A0AAN8EAP1_9EURO|nr:UV excision repair protein rad23 [Knufia obscura]KAK5949420.1 UV excision repair protein rad23 [Knufia fluminis]